MAAVYTGKKLGSQVSAVMRRINALEKEVENTLPFDYDGPMVVDASGVYIFDPGLKPWGLRYDVSGNYLNDLSGSGIVDTVTSYSLFVGLGYLYVIGSSGLSRRYTISTGTWETLSGHDTTFFGTDTEAYFVHDGKIWSGEFDANGGAAPGADTYILRSYDGDGVLQSTVNLDETEYFKPEFLQCAGFLVSGGIWAVTWNVSTGNLFYTFTSGGVLDAGAGANDEQWDYATGGAFGAGYRHVASGNFVFAQSGTIRVFEEDGTAVGSVAGTGVWVDDNVYVRDGYDLEVYNGSLVLDYTFGVKRWVYNLDQTEFYRYPIPGNSVIKNSLGAPDDGVSVPADTALVQAPYTTGYAPNRFGLKAVADALMRVLVDFIDPTTSEGYEPGDAVAQNIFNVAVQAGQYTWTDTIAPTHAGVPNQGMPYRASHFEDMDKILTQLEASDRGAGGLTQYTGSRPA